MRFFHICGSTPPREYPKKQFIPQYKMLVYLNNLSNDFSKLLQILSFIQDEKKFIAQENIEESNSLVPLAENCIKEWLEIDKLSDKYIEQLRVICPVTERYLVGILGFDLEIDWSEREANKPMIRNRALSVTHFQIVPDKSGESTEEQTPVNGSSGSLTPG
jgi:hypothetical protein